MSNASTAPQEKMNLSDLFEKFLGDTPPTKNTALMGTSAINTELLRKTADYNRLVYVEDEEGETREGYYANEQVAKYVALNMLTDFRDAIDRVPTIEDLQALLVEVNAVGEKFFNPTNEQQSAFGAQVTVDLHDMISQTILQRDVMKHLVLGAQNAVDTVSAEG